MHAGRESYGMVVALALALAAAVPAQEARSPVPKKEPAQQRATEPAPDAELLEFLGSFDTEDEDWVEYLTQTDVATPAASRPAPEAEKDE